MTDPWIVYTEEMDQVDGWFFGADVEHEAVLEGGDRDREIGAGARGFEEVLEQARHGLYEPLRAAGVGA